MAFQHDPVSGKAPPASGSTGGGWQNGAITGAIEGASAGVVLGLAYDGPGLVVCGLVGAAAGAVVGGLLASFSGGGGNGAAELALEKYFASDIINKTDYGLAWAHTNSYNVNQVIPDTQIYLARNAEWAAKQLYDYQSLYGLNHTYNASYVLEKSLVSNATLADIWQTAYNYNSVLALYTNLADQFTGTYSKMDWRFNAAGVGQTYFSDVTHGFYGRMQSGMMKPISETPGFMQVSDKMPIWIVNRFDTSTHTTLSITNYKGAVTTVPLTIEGLGIQSVNLTSLGLPSGRYSFTVPDSSSNLFAFGILGSDSLTSSVTYPAMLMTVDHAGLEEWTFMNVNGQSIYAGTSTNSISNAPFVGVQVSDTTWYNSVKMTNIFSDLNAANSECKNLTTIANMYAQTYYNQVVAANGHIATPYADIVMPDPDQLSNLNASQLIALYYSYLLTMKDWFNTSTILAPSDINITGGNLLVRGAVYDPAGHEIVSNTTIFTPFLTLADAELKLGWNNITQPGFLETWYNAATIKAASTQSNLTYVEFGTGWRMHIEEILYEDKSVSSVNLTLHTWDFIINQDLNSTPPPQAQTDLSWIISHWYYIGMVLGAVLVMAWIPTKSSAIGIIGLILLAASLGGWYLAGDHSILTWLGLNLQVDHWWIWGK